MEDRLQTGGAWLETKRRAHMSGAVTINRGLLSTANVPATPGRSSHDLDDGGGGIITVESHDFLIAPADYLINAVAVEPARGDHITDAANVVYEVLPFGAEPEWRWCDAYRQTYRVHTKQVD